MTIAHHPSEATLVAYGAGSLADGPALVVATHISLCPLCRETLADIEALGGLLLETLPSAPLAPDAFARLLPRLGEPDPPPEPPPRPGMAPDEAVTPEPLRSRLGSDIADMKWRFLVPGIRYVEVAPRTKAGGNTMLFRVAPGMSLSLHGHDGEEQTVILKGAYSDRLGRFRVGDFCETDETIEHQPVADPEGECICLICTQSPLRFANWMSRALQPFIRI